MSFLAQVETAAELARQAGRDAGWTAMALVVLVTAALGLFAYMVRGDRMELREINKFIRTEMPDVIDANSIMMARFIAWEKKCPAMNEANLDHIQSGNGTKIDSDEFRELDATAQKAIARVKRRADRRAKNMEDSSQG
jgi:hypothetical protein